MILSINVNAPAQINQTSPAVEQLFGHCILKPKKIQVLTKWSAMPKCNNKNAIKKIGHWLWGLLKLTKANTSTRRMSLQTYCVNVLG